MKYEISLVEIRVRVFPRWIGSEFLVRGKLSLAEAGDT